MRTMMSVLAGTVLASSAAPGLMAQQMAVALGGLDNAITASRQTPAVNPLETRVTVSFTDVSLKAALDEIVRVSGVPIVYGSAVVPLEKSVSVRATSKPLGDVLKQVLQGTNAAVRLADAGRVVIERQVQGSVRTGVVVGKVISAKTKQPVSGATVLVNDATSGVTTGADGTFRLTLPAGEHTIRVRMVGFTRQGKTITIGEGEQAAIEVSLEPSASVLDEVIVTGTVVATERRAIPNPITVITADEISRRGITRIEELFRGDIPGVVALERGSFLYSANNEREAVTSQVYARGSSSLSGAPNPLKTFVDGVELTDPTYLGTIDPRSIERIEVVTGPQAATIYGSGAMGGVMQIFTKRGSQQAGPDLALTLRYGVLQNSANTTKTPMHQDLLSVSGGTGPAFSYAGTVSYDYTGQWVLGLFNRRYGGSLGATHAMGLVTITGSVSLTGGSNGTVDTCCNSPLQSKMRASGDWAPSVNAQARPAAVNQSTSQTISLNVDVRPLPWWQHHVTLGKNQNEFNMVPPAPRLRSPGDTLFEFRKSVGSRVTAGYNTTIVVPQMAMFSHVMTFGMNGSLGRGHNYGGTAPTKNANQVTPWSVGQNTDESWGGFGNWRIGLFDRLYATVGIRGERNPTYGRAHKIDWTPTNGLAYTIDVGEMTIKLLGSYGRATRPPLPDQRDAMLWCSEWQIPGCYETRIAAPTLTPEYSRGPQGGIEVYYGNRASFTLNRYVQRVTDLIQEVYGVDSVLLQDAMNPSISYWSTQSQHQNIASIRQHGLELSGTVNIASLALKGTYSWSDSRIVTVNPNASGAWQYYAGMSFLRTPTHFGGLVATYAKGRASVTMATSFIGQAWGYGERGDVLLYGMYSRLRMYTVQARQGSLFLRKAAVKSNLTASHRVSGWATASLNIINLGNSISEESSALFPALGRQVLMGLSLRYPMQ